ncbi:PIR protein, putative [Plasmodium sp.]|nr:PIR protein, putative [Plasmodium sp.]
MKLHYTNILLFSLALNILTHSKNKRHITPHNTPTIIPRVLSECDIRTSIYDNDEDMKSVKENFDRQTSQRFEEYEEDMITQRKKYKEQRDKDIQKIILKDNMEKSLTGKVEKGCLRCGFGLGGIGAGVGIFGAIAVNEWTKAATAAAVQKGIKVGIAKAIDDLGNIVGLSDFKLINLAAIVTPTTFNKRMELVYIVNEAYNKCTDLEAAKETLYCLGTEAMGNEPNVSPVPIISREAANAAIAAGEAAKAAEEAEMVLVNAESTRLYIAIGYSVLAILIILLVMVIIYLILRYRRKKKMNKKAQYTKLLNQ